MFNAKLRKNAIDNYNAAVERYEKAANYLGENTNYLYKEREEALKLVKFIEERINQLANTPKEFKVTLQRIEIGTVKSSSQLWTPFTMSRCLFIQRFERLLTQVSSGH